MRIAGCTGCEGGNEAGICSIDELIRKVNKKAKTVVVPNIYGYNLLFPQIKTNVIDDVKGHLNIHGVLNTAHRGAVRNISSYNDENLDAILKEDIAINKKIELALCVIEDQKSYKWDDIRKQFFEGLSKIEAREKQCDIRISDFIRNNYKEVQLWNDPGHPKKELIIEMGKRILIELGVEECNKVPVEIDEDGGELPIYESVRAALKLSFEQKYLRNYRRNFTMYDRPINKREYVEQYFLWRLEAQ